MTVLCPRCGLNEYTPYGEERSPDSPPPPALSRTSREENDAPIYVCSDCGSEEAMEDAFGGGATPPEQWPILRSPTFGLGKDAPRPKGES